VNNMKCPNCGSEEHNSNGNLNQCIECGMLFENEGEQI